MTDPAPPDDLEARYGPELVECKLTMPNMDSLYEQIRSNARYAKRMAWGDPGRGRTVAICGAGPSLAAHVADIGAADDIWACNSALPYLWDRGVRVTHGFGIDQGEGMLTDWARPLPVAYYLASSVHPALVRHLRKAKRRLTFFHSYLGIPDPEGWVAPLNAPPGYSHEMELYTGLYGNSVQVGFGLNSVQRAVCLALFLEYDRIIVYGADCACAPDAPPMPPLRTPEYVAWIRAIVMYADGRTAGIYGDESVMAEADIDGRRWHTRPDMVISARHMLDLCVNYPGRITLVGDTLPNALAAKGPEFWARMPTLAGVGHLSGFGNAARVHSLAREAADGVQA